MSFAHDMNRSYREAAILYGEGPHKFSSTQFNLPGDLAAKIKEFKIPAEDLGDEGAETTPHITVKYGLHTKDAGQVRELVEDFGAVEVTLGKTSLFSNDDADVLIVEVRGKDLHELNAIIGGKLECTDTHPEYKPHVTITYLKPGKGKAYAGRDDFEGERISLSDLIFSPSEGEKTSIPINSYPTQYAESMHCSWLVTYAEGAPSLAELLTRLRRLGPSLGAGYARELLKLLERDPTLRKKMPGRDLAMLEAWKERKDYADASGHEHKPAGPGGGQFTGGGGAAKHGERAKAANSSYRELIAKAKAARTDAFKAVKADAAAAHAKAAEHFDSLVDANGGIAWDSSISEDEKPFDELEELISDFDEGGSVSERFTALGEIADKAKEAAAVKQTVDADLLAEDVATNQKMLAKIIASAKSARQELRAYTRHRKELASIKSGEDRTDYAGQMHDSYVAYAFEESKHPRGQPENAGQFGPGGGKGKASAEKAKPAAKDKPKASEPAALKIKSVKQRAFNGQSVPIKTPISKQESGKIGEALVIAWLHSQGMKDAAHMNLDRNNFPIDLIQDHKVIEAKTGLVSNSAGAQQWRLTIGEPGKAEKAWLAKASEKAKAKWNAKKQAMITARKQQALADLSKHLGKPIKPATITVLLNPDTKTADIYVFDGWHDRIGWKSAEATAAYKGTVQYA